jgi:hypothetical protein
MLSARLMVEKRRAKDHAENFEPGRQKEVYGDALDKAKLTLPGASVYISRLNRTVT